MQLVKHWIHKLLWLVWGNEQRIRYMQKKGAKIGSDCYISRNVKYGTEPYLISIGNHVRLTSNVQFITHDGSMWVLRGTGVVSSDTNIYGKIKIGNNVNVGWNTVIMPGVTIGNNCIIGVNSVVTRNIPDECVAAGAPARVICSLEEYIKKHEKDFIQIGDRHGIDKEYYITKILDKG